MFITEIKPQKALLLLLISQCKYAMQMKKIMFMTKFKPQKTLLLLLILQCNYDLV